MALKYTITTPAPVEQDITEQELRDSGATLVAMDLGSNTVEITLAEGQSVELTVWAKRENGQAATSQSLTFVAEDTLPPTFSGSWNIELIGKV